MLRHHSADDVEANGYCCSVWVCMTVQSPHFPSKMADNQNSQPKAYHFSAGAKLARNIMYHTILFRPTRLVGSIIDCLIAVQASCRWPACCGHLGIPGMECPACYCQHNRLQKGGVGGQGVGESGQGRRQMGYNERHQLPPSVQLAGKFSNNPARESTYDP